MAGIGIVTAVSNPTLEAVVLAGLRELGDEVTVVRRCVEIADVLAVSASGLARAVVIGADLPGLDADVIRSLADHAVVPIAITEPGERWAGAYGFAAIVEASGEPARIAAEIAAAARSGIRAPMPPAEPASSTADGVMARPGKVIAVWGPAGAPGRSTVALGLADELSRRGHPTLLIDADPYGGAQAAMLGLLDESPGIAAACRAAGAGTLDVAALARTCLQVAPSLRLLTGISRSDRWPELRPAGIETVLEQARALATVTIVDCGFCIEEDEELSYDSLAPRRNAATTTVLEHADEVLLVTGCDPVRVARGIRAVQELRELLPDITPHVIANQARSGVLHTDVATGISDAFEQYVGLTLSHVLPYDRKACDAALLRAQMVAEVAPSSPLRKALVQLAARYEPEQRSAVQRRPRRLRAR